MADSLKRTQTKMEDQKQQSSASGGGGPSSQPSSSTSTTTRDQNKDSQKPMNPKKRKFEPNKRQSNSDNQNTHHLTSRDTHGGHSGHSGDNNQRWTRLTGAPAWDLPTNDPTHAQQFTGRCRLFVANLPQSATEDSLRELFQPFGQIADIYIGKANQFAFVKMDTKLNAETAKNNLDGRPLEGRTLRVRLAAHAAAVRVSNLPPLVSNELLALAFQSFGPVERAVVSADDRGRSLGEGIVEFARKNSASAAIKKCQNECLLLSNTPMPVVVTPLEARDEEEGVPEKTVTHAQDYRAEREAGPRFAEAGTVEWEMARKWKQLWEIESQRKEQLESEMRDLRSELRQQMEFVKIEATTKQLREQLRAMESESQKLCAERERRVEEERRREEHRRQTELMLRQQEEQLLRRSGEDLGQLRRQESELRQQANALQQLLDRQEQALRQMQQPTGIGAEMPQLDPLNGHSLAFSQQQQSSVMAPPPAVNQPMSVNQFQLNQSPFNPIPGRQMNPQLSHQTPQFGGQRSGGQQMGGANYGHSHYKRNRRF